MLLLLVGSAHTTECHTVAQELLSHEARGVVPAFYVYLSGLNQCGTRNQLCFLKASVSMECIAVQEAKACCPSLVREALRLRPTEAATGLSEQGTTSKTAVLLCCKEVIRDLLVRDHTLEMLV